MPQWEYAKIDLSDVPNKQDDIAGLNEAGKHGWELVMVTTNNFAYLKRQIGEAAAAAKSTRHKTATPRAQEG